MDQTLTILHQDQTPGWCVPAGQLKDYFPTLNYFFPPSWQILHDVWVGCLQPGPYLHFGVFSTYNNTWQSDWSGGITGPSHQIHPGWARSCNNVWDKKITLCSAEMTNSFFFAPPGGNAIIMPAPNPC